MKRILSKATSLFLFLFLALIVVTFVYGLGQRSQATQEQPAYPAPEPVAEQSLPYPAPLQSNPVPTAGNFPEPQWVTYHDEEAGYSFTYKSSFLIFDGKNKGEPFNHVRLYLGSGGNMVISILENPQQLPLEQFLKTDYSIYSQQPDDTWKAADFSEHTQPLMVDGQAGVLVERSDVTFSITGLAKYVVFIPYGNYVVQTVLEPTEIATPNEPSADTVETFNEIVNSFQFEQ